MGRTHAPIHRAAAAAGFGSNDDFPAGGVEQANALNLQWLVPYLPAYLATKAVGECVSRPVPGLSPPRGETAAPITVTP